MNPTTLSNAEKLLMSAKWNGPLRNCNKSCNGYTDVSILLVTAIVDCCRVVDRWKPNVSVKPEPISDHEKKKNQQTSRPCLIKSNNNITAPPKTTRRPFFFLLTLRIITAIGGRTMRYRQVLHRHFNAFQHRYYPPAHNWEIVQWCA